MAHAVDEGEAADLATGRLREALCADLDAGFADLVREYQQVVHAIVLRINGDHADAEDLAAEVFLRAYRALREYPASRITELKPRPWLVTIALNLSRNTARDRTRQPRQVALQEYIERSGTADAFDDVAARLDLQRVLAELTRYLPEQQRTAVLLRHFCGLTVTELAGVLGCPEGTARSHVSRGLSRLRTLLVERYPRYANGAVFPGVNGSGRAVEGGTR